MHLRYLLSAFLFSMVLTGCGVVANLIPPIEVGDMFGVDQQSVTAQFSDGQGLVTQAVSSAEDTIERSFEDMDLDLRGFSLKELDAGISIDTSLTLTRVSSAAEFPVMFTLTKLSVDATVSDEVHGSANLEMEHSASLVYERVDSSVTATSATYTLVSGSALGALSIEVNADERDLLAKVVDIIRLDGESSVNAATVKVSLEADSNPSLAGFSATFKLISEGTKVKLGG